MIDAPDIIKGVTDLFSAGLVAELLAEYVGAITNATIIVTERNALQQEIDLADADKVIKELTEAFDRMLARIESELGELDFDTANAIREAVLTDMLLKARMQLDEVTRTMKANLRTMGYQVKPDKALC